MRHGFIKAAAHAPIIRLADCEFNAERIIDAIKAAEREGVKLLVFPELCVTGYTCGDLFFQTSLISAAAAALLRITRATESACMVVVCPLPIELEGKIYSAAAVISRGEVLGVVPKRFLADDQRRHFCSAPEHTSMLNIEGTEVPFGLAILFSCETMSDLSFAIELGEEAYLPALPSVEHVLAGASIIVNPSACPETVGRAAVLETMLKSLTKRLSCGYIHAEAGICESSTDAVYSGRCAICEDGRMLAMSAPFTGERAITEIDVSMLVGLRRRQNMKPSVIGHLRVGFALEPCETQLTRKIDMMPFVPADAGKRADICEEALRIQAAGLMRRLMHTNSKCVVLGISGGLDSTLALLVACRAMDMLSRPHSDVIAVTMPGLGTTARTKNNAELLARELGAALREIDISESVRLHFRDIGHDEDKKNTTYENAQARERTQILMDIANDEHGFVVGTGDMSELALGWATFGGDHISMYNPNGGVPKTLVYYLVSHAAETADGEGIRRVLRDILDTPITPELLPADGNTITQKTEEIVGPYELHDFFIYYSLRHGFSPKKIFRLACLAYTGAYTGDVILNWLKYYYTRLIAHQFKRNCACDGARIGSVSLSPRGGLTMPSDASFELWLNELKDLES